MACLQSLRLKAREYDGHFEGAAVFGDFMNSQLDQPVAYKIDSTGRAVYRCIRDFSPLRSVKNIIPKMVDSGVYI